MVVSATLSTDRETGRLVLRHVLVPVTLDTNGDGSNSIELDLPFQNEPSMLVVTPLAATPGNFVATYSGVTPAITIVVTAETTYADDTFEFPVFAMERGA